MSCAVRNEERRVTVEVVDVVNLIDKQKYLLCRRW